MIYTFIVERSADLSAEQFQPEALEESG